MLHAGIAGQSGKVDFPRLYYGFPAIFRGDLLTGVLVLLLSASSFWIVAIIWAFLYNRVYTTRLLERGYVFDDAPDKVAEAKRVLQVHE